MSEDPFNNGRKLAPIALFAYNRPDHFRRTVEALAGNDEAKESDLVIYSDAPKTPEQTPRVQQVRDYIRTIKGFRSVRVIERSENLGLARSIISGVTELVSSHGRVIVIEDDIVTSPSFLRYMNEGLDLYADEQQVASIHGYNYPIKDALPETFFLRGADCWGWATWKRAWDKFEPDGNKLLSQLRQKKLVRSFDLDGSYGFSKMLERQIRGENDSWAIRWHASVFLAGMLTLYPGKSLVQNIGFDGSGTNSKAYEQFTTSLANPIGHIRKIEAVEDMAARAALARYFGSLKPGIWQRLRRKLRDVIISRQDFDEK